jgi:hypothetical protein
MGGGSKQRQKLKKVSKPANDNFSKERQQQKQKAIAKKNAKKKINVGNAEYDRAVQNLHARMNGPKKTKREGNLTLSAPSFAFNSNVNAVEEQSVTSPRYQLSADSLLEDESGPAHIAAPKPAKKRETGGNTNPFAMLDDDEDVTRVIELQPSFLSKVNTEYSDDDDL